MEITVLCPFELDSGLLSKTVSIGQGAPVRVLVPSRDAAAAVDYGAKYIHTVDDLGPDETAIAACLEEFIRKTDSKILLAPATVRMRGILPQLACRLRAGLTADCTELALENGKLLQVRPAFGNSLMATILTKSPIQMATVRPGCFPAVKQPCSDPVIVKETFSSPHERVTCQGYRPFEDHLPLHQAEIMIAGGLGVGSKAGFEKLHRLAALLGGTVAASRSAVDAGFAPYSCQVGMTGTCVSPQIYLAFGISGAVQHLAGISGSKTIIAINSDPKAPIFDYADYGIVGDWETVVHKLLEELS